MGKCTCGLVTLVWVATYMNDYTCVSNYTCVWVILLRVIIPVCVGTALVGNSCIVWLNVDELE